LASNLGRFTHKETATGTHWIGVSVGPRAGLEAVEEIKVPAPACNRSPVIQCAALCYTDCAIPAHRKIREVGK
jgi:hypothetical protein